MVYEDAVIRVGNKGTVFDITMYDIDGSTQTAVDLSTATTLNLEFRRRNGSIQSVVGAIKNAPGGDGIIRYTDSTGTVFAHSLAKRGRWAVRGVIIYANGNTFKGSWQGFTVGE